MEAQEQRRLLELAAKAAGMKARYFADHWPGLKVFGDPRPWSPLTDDGDALRLAVKLGIDVVISASNPARTAACPDIGCDYLEEDHGTDPYAATRLAIVRAAAAIGEKMEAKP